MSKRAVEHIFNGITTPYTSYDSTKTNLGKLIVQMNSEEGSFAGPIPTDVGRPAEQPVAGLLFNTICAIPGSKSNKDWIFLGDGSTAAATRNVMMYVFDRQTLVFDCVGYITLTFPNTGNKTITDIQAARHTYSTGTVAVSGTAVSGTNTAWQTARFAVGGRIGFGSTDPNSITDWYEISAIGDDTSITLASSAGTVSGVEYVIEELRIFLTVSSSTANQGGLNVVKGLNPNTFDSVPAIIPAANSTDNVRAVYWLKDAATVNTTALMGIGYKSPDSATSHLIYVVHRESSSKFSIFQFNLRASLTLSSGAATTAFEFRTATDQESGVALTIQHGVAYTSLPANLWIAGSAKLIAVPESSIANGQPVDVSKENAFNPAFQTTYVTPQFDGIEYLPEINRLLCFTGIYGKSIVVDTSATPASWQFVAVFSGIDFQLDQSLSLSASPHPKLPFTIASQDGLCYVLQTTLTAAANTLYAVPYGTDWATAAGSSAAEQERLITPSLDTTGATKLLHVYANNLKYLGDQNLGTPCEAFRMYARTSGISDDSGEWTALDRTGNLSELTVTNEIQLMFEFRMFGLTNIPGRIFNATVVYEDGSTDSHFVPSVYLSDATNYQFAWNFLVGFNQTVPTIRVLLYDAVAGGAAIVDDNTASPTGTFEKSTDNGDNWTAWNTTDLSNRTTYLRYTPSAGDQSSLADKTIRALLTLN